MKTYTASGLVYGKYWGGGSGAYKASSLEAKTIKGILSQARTDLKTGALDSGMGYESLTGALLNIEIKDTIIIKDKTYINTEYKQVFIGKLTAKEKDFLIECDLNN